MEGLEDDLVEKLKTKNNKAYNQMIECYGEKLLRLAYIIVGDYQLAEDVLQESYINIYKNINRFNGNSNLLTWITRITINNAKYALKKKKRKSRILLHDNINQNNQLFSVDYEIIKKEEISKIREILMNLPLKYRETLYLFYYEEIKIKDIALILDISESGVKTRLQRGRHMLEDLLRKELN